MANLKGAFSIDEISEEEDQQSSQPTNSSNSARRLPNQPIISQDYFSSVMASLSSQMLPGQQQQQQQIQTQSQPQPQPTQQQQQQQPDSSQSRIERDFFQSVMQNLLNPTQNNRNTGTNPSSSISSHQQPSQQQPTNLTDEDLASKLELMHELGFLDDELNIRALQITEGNVEAAVSFIMESGEI